MRLEFGAEYVEVEQGTPRHPLIRTVGAESFGAVTVHKAEVKAEACLAESEVEATAFEVVVARAGDAAVVPRDSTRWKLEPGGDLLQELLAELMEADFGVVAIRPVMLVVVIVAGDGVAEQVDKLLDSGLGDGLGH